ncbi:MAG: NAD(P)/FAD-dependent oxidoreductase [Actinoplanes sp.]
MKALRYPSADLGTGAFSRRSVLKAAGLTAAAASTGLLYARPAAAAETTYDAIVIGGGFAGLTTARELKNRGLTRILILEARDRIGGRAQTITFNGRKAEFGANWVSPNQFFTMAELNRYGITPVVEPGLDRVVMPTPSGPASYSPDEAFGHQGELLARLFEGSQNYWARPHEPLYRSDLLARVDQLSLRDKLNQLALSAQDESWLTGLTAGYSGGSSQRGGLTALAQWWALGGHTVEGWHGINTYRLPNGMQELLQRILTASGAEVRLNSPVRLVEDDTKEVRVTTTSGQVFRAPVAVVAAPVNVWKTIEFRPGLPAAHAAASNEGVGVPTGTKFITHLRGVSDSVYAQSTEGAPVTILLPHSLVSDGAIMIGFSVDPNFNPNNIAQVQAGVSLLLPQATVVSVTGKAWAQDPYSRGGWALRRPGQVLRQLPAIQQPHGRVAFASGDAANGWTGYVDGAIESGFRAAGQAYNLAGSLTTAAVR